MSDSPPSTAIIPRPVPPAGRSRGPVLTHQQRVQNAAVRKEKQLSIDETILAWFKDSAVVANDMSERFGQTPEHFLNRMFSGALKLHAAQRKPNGYNAYLHHIASEDGGKSVVELADTHREKYAQLSDEEKQQYIDELADFRHSQQYGLRLDQRSRTQDVNFVMKEVEQKLAGLRARSGVDAFICLVRNTTEYQLRPRWHFTNPALEDFLVGNVRGFDIHKIGALAEAFAMSGSDYFNQLRNATEKVNYLKGAIRDLISQGLINITNDQNAQMSYVNFTRDIQIGYGVTIVGWTHTKWAKPSDLGNSLPPLKDLYDALKSGKCRFVSLSASQLDTIKKDYNCQLGVEAAHRKKRSDAGKPRKKRGSDKTIDEDASDAESAPSKRRRVAASTGQVANA